jgi:hypothetical protein
MKQFNGSFCIVGYLESISPRMTLRKSRSYLPVRLNADQIIFLPSLMKAKAATRHMQHTQRIWEVPIPNYNRI